mmetsp:Transcript_28971/g.52482  ORF Transcript_28971/g.52482 Transcript_28971/m.52482 type:complete len:200 (+) Transcript_28971:94-693(+)
MSDQKCRDKVEMWTSKLGKQYRKDEVDFNAAEAELNSIRNLPENKRCADCGTQGTVWSSVNLGVFTCMRCGSFHRALGTHISKPKGCTGTYLWSPDEVQRMKEIGNARAETLYGSSKAMASLPSSDASRNQWLEFFRDKYERRRWVEVADGKCTKSTPPQLPRQQEVATEDLSGLQQGQNSQQPTNQSSSEDFFAQFDL